MIMKKTIEELKKELVDMKASNNAAWSLYGSELCAGDMLAEEAKLELEIKIAEGIKKWEDSGLLDGNVKENWALLFEANPSQMINEKE